MVKKKPTVALFGGSFDPPHRGHKAIVTKLASLDDIDYVVIMPAFVNPFKKKTTASGKKRLEWCQEVFTGNKVIISDFEISQNRSIYTIETLHELSRKYDVKYLAIGSDNLPEIKKWHEFDRINSMITWLVFTRGSTQPDARALRSYKLIELKIPISSTEIRMGRSLEQLDEIIADDVKNTILKDKNDNQR